MILFKEKSFTTFHNKPVVQDLKAILTNLEQLVGGQGGSHSSGGASAASYPSFSQFDAVVAELREASTHGTDPALKEITELAVKGFDLMKTVLAFTYNVKKPAPEQFKPLKKPFDDNLNKIHKFGSNQAVQAHVKVVVEGLGILFWVFQDAPKQVIESVIESTEFYGLKVQKEKVPENTKWYNLFIKALKTLQEYTVQNFPMGVNWNVKGTKTVEDLVAALSGAKPAGGVPPPPPPSKLPPPPPVNAPLQPAKTAPADTAALFAELNVGEDITKRLKKVDKNAVQEQRQAPVPVSQPKRTQQQAPQSNKTPARFQKDNQLFIENFVNENLIQIEEDEMDMKNSLFVDNCTNVGILIKSPKIKSILLQKCNKIQIHFEQVVSSCELVGCKRIEVTCTKSVPTFMCDNSESVHLSLNGSTECEILTAKTIDFNVTYLQEDGEHAKDTPLPEQFLTVFDKEAKKFVTKPHEAHFG